MDTHISSQPYGMLVMTDHQALLFSSAPAEPRAQFQSGEYILLYPYWYHVTDQSILRCVGKTAAAPHHVARTRVTDWQLELETLLDLPLDQRLIPRTTILSYVVIFHLQRTASLQEDPSTCFPPRAYALIGRTLYTTDGGGRLYQALGELKPETVRSEDDFHRRLKDLTGLDSRTDIRDLG